MLTAMATLKEIKKEKDHKKEIDTFKTTIPHKDLATSAGVFLTDAKHGIEDEGEEVIVPNKMSKSVYY